MHDEVRFMWTCAVVHSTFLCNKEGILSYPESHCWNQDIIRLPRLFRFLQRPLAQFISTLRAPKSAEGYAAIGGGSPLRQMTAEQVYEWPLISFYPSSWSCCVSAVIDQFPISFAPTCTGHWILVFWKSRNREGIGCWCCELSFDKSMWMQKFYLWSSTCVVFPCLLTGCIFRHDQVWQLFLVDVLLNCPLSVRDVWHHFWFVCGDLVFSL
jgi:hypothetical protein